MQRPSTDAIIKIASYFKVSTDYLLIGSETSKPIYSSEDAEWISLIHKLPRDAQLEFKGELKGYIKGMNRSADNSEKLREAK